MDTHDVGMRFSAYSVFIMRMLQQFGMRLNFDMSVSCCENFQLNAYCLRHILLLLGACVRASIHPFGKMHLIYNNITAKWVSFHFMTWQQHQSTKYKVQILIERKHLFLLCTVLFCFVLFRFVLFGCLLLLFTAVCCHS